MLTSPLRTSISLFVSNLQGIRRTHEQAAMSHARATKLHRDALSLVGEGSGADYLAVMSKAVQATNDAGDASAKCPTDNAVEQTYSQLARDYCEPLQVGVLDMAMITLKAYHCCAARAHEHAAHTHTSVASECTHKIRAIGV